MNLCDQTIPCTELRVAAVDVPLTEEMLGALDLAGSCYTNLETGLALVWVFAASPTAAEAARARIAEGLPAWAAGFQGPLPTPAVVHLRQEDWAHSWRRLFKAFRISRRLVLKPSWEAWPAAAGDLVIELDPGMCFGTGYHGTTRACLEFMDDLAARLGAVAFLDAGCGSGILSLAAAKLGFDPIYAFDHDPQAVQMARENLAGAGVRHVPLVSADLADYVPPRPCRVVAANILAPVLLAQRQHLCQWLDLTAGPAYLVLAGILAEQYPPLRDAMCALGCREVGCRAIDEWTSGCFECAP